MTKDKKQPPYISDYGMTDKDGSDAWLCLVGIGLAYVLGLMGVAFVVVRAMFDSSLAP